LRGTDNWRHRPDCEDSPAKADAGRIIAAVDAKLTEYPREQDLANGEAWI
jgi:hypothetical protein